LVLVLSRVPASADERSGPGRTTLLDFPWGSVYYVTEEVSLVTGSRVRLLLPRSRPPRLSPLRCRAPPDRFYSPNRRPSAGSCSPCTNATATRELLPLLPLLPLLHRLHRSFSKPARSQDPSAERRARCALARHPPSFIGLPLALSARLGLPSSSAQVRLTDTDAAARRKGRPSSGCQIRISYPFFSVLYKRCV
jgi:hypothetical protein